jgi:hypothetical protein
MQLSGGGGDRSWKDDEKFVASFQGHRFESINGDKAGILMFMDVKGELFERWETKAWSRMIFGEPKSKDRPAVKPTLKQNDVVEVTVGGEKKLKGGKRFRRFEVDLLTGKDIPKTLR